MTTYDVGAPLPPNVLALLRHLVRYLNSDELGTSIVAQAQQAAVVRGSATMIDLTPRNDLPPVELPDGPIPLQVFVQRADEPTGEILVWIDGGELIGLEQAWWTDDPPTDWPTPEQVRVA